MAYRMKNMGYWSMYQEIEEEIKKVNSFMQINLKSRNKFLDEVVKKQIDSGGKRLRPAFVVLCAKFGAYDSEKVITVASAVEILHTATLVHDDIIDEAKLRRGNSSVVDKHGIDMAVYTGDFLFTKAVLLLSGKVPADKLEIIARVIKSICEGEVDQYQDRYNFEASIYSYLKRISRKTAALFGAAGTLGAFLSNCKEKTGKTLAKFCYYYGMAFQIRDDINDFVEDVEKSGKPVGNDIKKGNFNAPLIYGIRNNKNIRSEVEEYINNAEKNDVNINKLILLVKESRGIEDSLKLMNLYILRALTQLEKLNDNQYKEILSGLVKKLNIF